MIAELLDDWCASRFKCAARGIARPPYHYDPRLSWWRRIVKAWREWSADRTIRKTEQAVTIEDLAAAIVATDYAKTLADESGEHALADRLWRRARELEHVKVQREHEEKVRQTRLANAEHFLAVPCEDLIAEAKAAPDAESALVLLREAGQLASRAAELPELMRAVKAATVAAQERSTYERFHQ
jgi:hypothetical protein